MANSIAKYKCTYNIINTCTAELKIFVRHSYLILRLCRNTQCQQISISNTLIQEKMRINLQLFVLFFSVWLLSVLRGHSVFSSPPQRPMTSDFEGFLSQILSITFFPYLYYICIQKEPVFPFLMLSAKQGNYRYHFYNVFGMTRSLTGDWTRDLPHSKPALYH